MLVAAAIPHAALDLDWLCVMYPPQGRYGEPLVVANLAAVWPVYKAAGAERLLVARVIEHRSELERYRDAIPGADIVVCRLTASAETMRDRLRDREPGMFQTEAIARSAELEQVLERERVEDFTVDNDAGGNVTEVAREVLTRAGWP